jgi:O-antigen ligase
LKMCLFYMAFRMARDMASAQALIKWYVVGAVIAAIVATIQQFSALQESMDAISVTGTFEARNELTFYLAPAVVLSVAVIAANPGSRVLAVLAFGALALALALSRGRAGTFFALAGVATYMGSLAMRRGISRRLLGTATAIGLVSIGMLAWWLTDDATESIRSRFSASVVTELDEERGSSFARLLVLEGAWNAWQQNIWFGIGAGNFAARSSEFLQLPYGEDVQPHSTYIGALAEIGIFGLLGLLLILLPVLRTIFSLRRYIEQEEFILGVAVAYLVVLAHLMTFDGIARYPLWIFAGICYGLTSSRAERRFGLH